jgi:hypothetical protein
MTANSLSIAPPGPRPLFKTAIVVAIGLAALFTAAFSYGREARIKADQAEAALIAQEDQTFCTGFGFAAGSETYARCAKGLTEIRRWQKQRLELEAAGLI